MTCFDPTTMDQDANHHWEVIADAAELGGRLPVALRRFGQTVIVWRDPTGGVVGELDRCPHRAMPLSDGRSDGAGEVCLECIGDRSEEPLVLREAHGWIWMWRGDWCLSHPAITYFERVGPSWPSSTSSLVRDAAAAGATRTHLQLDASSPRVSRVSAVVPIDDERSQVYLRSYQHEVAIPGLGRVFARLDNLAHRRELARGAAPRDGGEARLPERRRAHA